MSNKPNPRNSGVTIKNPKLAQVLEVLPKEQKDIIVQALSISQTFSGPLPNGETLEIYDKIIPNGGDRLMKNVEKQLDHRIDLEKTGVRRSYNQSGVGQVFAFLIAIAFGFVAWDLAKDGKEITASILGGADLVALVTIFVTGSRSKK